MSGRLLLFGASGAIGTSLTEFFQKEGWVVIGVSRRGGLPDLLRWDPFASCPEEVAALLKHGPYDAVCWAQGMNGSDSVYDFDMTFHQDMYRSNVLFVVQSLNKLLAARVLAKGARLCVISSIWQNIARQDKLSYSITKAALRGLVLSAANDLAPNGYLINAVLPGVLDTPMTRQNLSESQLQRVVNATQFQRLPTLADVASAVYSLCSFHNTGVTGQFVTVDLGYSHVRLI